MQNRVHAHAQGGQLAQNPTEVKFLSPLLPLSPPRCFAGSLSTCASLLPVSPSLAHLSFSSSVHLCVSLHRVSFSLSVFP